MPKKLTIKNFIQKAKSVHGNKYDYSETNYVNSQLKVIIICKKHGKFLQTPNSHLNGTNCKKCKHKIPSTKEFINKANKIHNNKYSYSKVNYINAKTKVIIICKKHGEFLQTPNSHLNGTNCKKCSSKKMSLGEFIKKANKVYNNKYDYSKVNYVKSRTKIIIICPVHGKFLQRPDFHLKNRGCKKC